MRTFYLFKINNEYSKLTKNIPYNLYSTLLSIKLMPNQDLEYLKFQYDTFTDELGNLNQLIHSKMQNLDGYMIRGTTHIFNNYYTNETSRLQIFKSFMVLKTNVPNSTFFTFLYDTPNLFIIDFNNQDYFWLKQIGNLRLVNV